MGFPRIISFVFIACICLSQQIALGSSSLTDSDLYPLGGVWRVGFSSPLYHKLHLQMAREELSFTTEQDGKVQTEKYATNIALCQLNVYVDKGDGALLSHEILGVPDKLFLSGGRILLEERGDFVPIVHDREVTAEEIRRKKASISDLLKNLSKLTSDIDSKTASTVATTLTAPVPTVLVKLDEKHKECTRLLEEYEVLKVKAAKIHETEMAYKAESVFQDPEYEFKTHLYDAEQVIIRQIDRKLAGVTQTDTQIVVNESLNLAKDTIRGVVLHLHTRFDMCQYCLASLHRRFPVWKGRFGGLPFNIIVSSRQEYMPNALILYKFPTYKGTSMRYVGVDNRSRSLLSEEELASFSERGIVAQISLSAWEVLGL